MHGNRYSLQIDDKGRFRLPNHLPTAHRKLKEGDTITITTHENHYTGYYRCLSIYNMEKWQQLQEAITILSADVHSNRIRDQFIGSAQFCVIKNGKVLIPEILREEVDITIKSTVILQWEGTKYTLWNPENKQKLVQHNTEESLKVKKSDELKAIQF